MRVRAYRKVSGRLHSAASWSLPPVPVPHFWEQKSIYFKVPPVAKHLHQNTYPWSTWDLKLCFSFLIYVEGITIESASYCRED